MSLGEVMTEMDPYPNDKLSFIYLCQYADYCKRLSGLTVDLWPTASPIYINNKMQIKTEHPEQLGKIINAVMVDGCLLSLYSKDRIRFEYNIPITRVARHMEEMSRDFRSGLLQMMKHFYGKSTPCSEDVQYEKTMVFYLLLDKITRLLDSETLWNCFTFPYNTMDSVNVENESVLKAVSFSSKCDNIYNGLYAFLFMEDMSHLLTISKNGLELIHDVYERNCVWFQRSMPAVQEFLVKTKSSLTITLDMAYMLYALCILDNTALITDMECLQIFISIRLYDNAPILENTTHLFINTQEDVPRYTTLSPIEEFFCFFIYINMFSSNISIVQKDIVSISTTTKRLNNYVPSRCLLKYEYVESNLYRCYFGSKSSSHYLTDELLFCTPIFEKHTEPAEDNAFSFYNLPDLLKYKMMDRTFCKHADVCVDFF